MNSNLEPFYGPEYMPPEKLKPLFRPYFERDFETFKKYMVVFGMDPFFTLVYPFRDTRGNRPAEEIAELLKNHQINYKNVNCNLIQQRYFIINILRK